MSTYDFMVAAKKAVADFLCKAALPRLSAPYIRVLPTTLRIAVAGAESMCM